MVSITGSPSSDLPNATHFAVCTGSFFFHAQPSVFSSWGIDDSQLGLNQENREDYQPFQSYNHI